MNEGAGKQSDTSIEIVVNGERRSVPAEMRVSELVAEMGLQPERVALELNREILARLNWHTTVLAAGDRLEIVHFVGGG